MGARMYIVTAVAIASVWAGTAYGSPTFGATEAFSIEPSGAVSTASRFLFFKKCETKKKGGRDEKCCTGNFKCKEKVCEGSKVCRSFLKSFLWCKATKCTPKSTNPPLSEEEDDGTMEPSAAPEDLEASPFASPSPSSKSEYKPSPTPSESPSSSYTPSKSPYPSPTPSTSTVAWTPPPWTPQPTQPPISPPTPQPTHNPLHCIGNRYRKDIRDMEAWEIKRWSDAVMQLINGAPGEHRSPWERLVEVHTRYTDEAHGGCYFLPWHRLFLLQVENELRRIDSNIAMPYWDWTRDSEDPAMSAIWSENHIGGAKYSSPIPNGPFAYISSDVPHWHHVTREFDAGVSRSMGPLVRWSSLESYMYQGSFDYFSDGIIGAHVLPHLEIGGDMSFTARAPNDPVFYLHHAYVDFVWSIRQERVDRYQFSGTHDFGGQETACSADFILQAFGVPANTAFDQPCVHYEPPSHPGSNAQPNESPMTNGVPVGGHPSSSNAQGGRTTRAPHLKCDDTKFLEMAGLNAKRCRRSARIMQES